QILAEIGRRIGHDLGVLTAPMASRQLFESVPFYAGLTLELIGGRGIRWPETVAAAALPTGDAAPFSLSAPPPAPVSNGALRLGRYRSIWAAPEVEVSPALKFLTARQVAEMSPEDAGRLGIAPGSRVVVGSDGAHVEAEVAVRQ